MIAAENKWLVEPIGSIWALWINTVEHPTKKAQASAGYFEIEYVIMVSVWCVWWAANWKKTILSRLFTVSECVCAWLREWEEMCRPWHWWWSVSVYRWLRNDTTCYGPEQLTSPCDKPFIYLMDCRFNWIFPFAVSFFQPLSSLSSLVVSVNVLFVNGCFVGSSTVGRLNDSLCLEQIVDSRNLAMAGTRQRTKKTRTPTSSK